jgi:hypothetical protein
MSRYLSKSRFKQALECPRKLYYTGKPDYADTSMEDEFLAALAEGGFQVGELAKLHFPEGIEITARDQADQIRQTAELLQQTEVILFEATLQTGDFLARVDILQKQGDQIHLIEVKAKSFDSREGVEEWWTVRPPGRIKSDILPYLQDIAFQTHVFQLAYPGHRVYSELMLVDKAKRSSVDGLNQCFKIHKETSAGKRRVWSAPLPGVSLKTIGSSVLTRVPVDKFVDHILSEDLVLPGRRGNFSILAKDLGSQYAIDADISPPIGAHCADCQFRNPEYPKGLKSGFHECWKRTLNWDDAQVTRPLVLDLFNSRSKQHFIESGKYFLDQIAPEDLDIKGQRDGLSISQRQWFQCSGEWPGGGEFFLDRPAMANEMARWQYPLHFIDFEACRPALPFKAGKPGYGLVAFQFSHHVMEADGTVRHANEFLDARPGNDPNPAFVTALAKALEGPGTVFMWSPYENTVLKALQFELDQGEGKGISADKNRLVEFLLSLTTDSKTKRRGSRAMVDLASLASRYFFHPHTKGRSSIKVVLPAVLQASGYLRRRYSMPCYGTAGGISSKNFKDMAWWQADPGTGQVRDPYKLLPPIFDDIGPQALAKYEYEEKEGIREGGAAATAYVRLQFSDMEQQRRDALQKALLRYCELDTLAMVMVVEAWQSFVHVTLEW